MDTDGVCTDLTHCRFNLGDLVAARGTVCGCNKNGGLILFDRHREWHVTIVRGWHDDERGWRFWGKLTSAHLADAIAEGAAGSLSELGPIGPEICFISEFEIIRVIKRERPMTVGSRTNWSDNGTECR